APLVRFTDRIAAAQREDIERDELHRMREQHIAARLSLANAAPETGKARSPIGSRGDDLAIQDRTGRCCGCERLQLREARREVHASTTAEQVGRSSRGSWSDKKSSVPPCVTGSLPKAARGGRRTRRAGALAESG